MGDAREVTKSHAAEIMYGRISDPYGDFSPLLLALLPEDNEHLTDLKWNKAAVLQKQVQALIAADDRDVFGGALELVADSRLVFRVFGHQHLFQVR